MGNKIDEYKKKINYDVWGDLWRNPPLTDYHWVDEVFADVWFDVTSAYDVTILNDKRRKKSGESDE
jgi:hypothetical protein